MINMATFTKQTKVLLSEEQYERLRKVADEKNESISSVIREVVDEFLEVNFPKEHPNTENKKKLRDYEFYGMWKDRDDLADSSVWVRRQREKWSERNSSDETDRH